MYIAAGQGQTTPGHKILMSTEISCHFGHLLQVSKPEDHWSCIAHRSAEDMLKSVVIEEKKFKHSPWAGADNSFGPKYSCQQEGLITMVICYKFK